MCYPVKFCIYNRTAETGRIPFTSNSRLKDAKIRFTTPYPCLRSEGIVLFFFKLQPKRALQYAQTITKPHPSNSRQSYMRMKDPWSNPVSKLHKHGGMMQKHRALFSTRVQQPVRFLSQVKPWRLYSQGCSVWSADGAQRKVRVGYPQVSVKRSRRVSRNNQTSKYPPFLSKSSLHSRCGSVWNAAWRCC